MVMFFDPVPSKTIICFFLKQYINLYKYPLFLLSSSVPPRFLNASRVNLTEALSTVILVSLSPIFCQAMATWVGDSIPGKIEKKKHLPKLKL